MRGTHAVYVANRRLDYRFELRRNITIVRGNSGTGKTTLYEMVADHTRLGQDSGVQISCDKDCVALVDLDWRAQLLRTRDSIVFLDEDAAYAASPEFARTIRETDNYYVIITREALYALPYSVEEIYQIRASGRYHRFERMYHLDEAHAYEAGDSRIASHYATVLVEDSHSGFQFLQHRVATTDIECVSAKGSASIYGWLREHVGQRVFVLADGAAFGAEAARVLALQDEHPDTITICLPESFGWLILASGILREQAIERVLNDPGSAIESKIYVSWEQFFTSFLRDITRGTPFAYSKAHLAQAYAIPSNANKIMALIAHGNVC